MALNTGNLMDLTFANVVKAEDFAFAAWSGAVTVALSVGYFGDGSLTEKQARQGLASEAAAIGINKNTWESYVGAMFKAADKLAKMASAGADGMASFHAIPDMADEDAVANVEMLLRSLQMETGGHIRDWTKQEGFDAYNPNAAKEARDRKALAKGAEVVGLLRANRGAAPGAISDTAAPAAPADPIAALAAILAGLDEAATLKALEAVNARLAMMQAAKAAAPAPDKVAPVVADDAVVAKLSSLGRVKHAA